MKIQIDCPPSVNIKEPFDLPPTPAWKRIKVWITVKPKIRLGDVDNRIKPVLDVLEKRGMKCVWVKASFGDENSVVIKNCCEGGSSERRQSASAKRNMVSVAESGCVGRGGRDGVRRTNR